MEPENVADYSKVEYWNTRYESENEYDWFSTVYPACLGAIVSEVETKVKQQPSVRILHLGTGNSKLVRDIAAQTSGQVEQVALDYSDIVINKMKASAPVPNVTWVVGDVRRLRELKECAQPFDIIIDKGTMDALQADKENDQLDEDLDAMLTDTSVLLGQSGIFLQFTWEVPYYRLDITKKEKYGWVNDSLIAKRLPETDMYYFYKYVKQ
jgi:hypothetical protein